jgi:hypothetical protein
VKIFNVGDYRRKLGLAGADKDFFDAKNAEARIVPGLSCVCFVDRCVMNWPRTSTTSHLTN